MSNRVLTESRAITAHGGIPRGPRRTALLTALLVALVVSAASRADAGAPRLVLAEDARDFGRVAPGDAVAHEFAITNEGDAPLTLGDVKPSRGATVIRYDTAIAPGQTGHIRLAADTWSFRGSPRLAVALSTNDPARPIITVQIKVNVEPYVAASPGHARYLTYQGGPRGTITQTLWDADGTDFRVVGVESPYSFIDVSYREARAEERDSELPGRQWRVDATIASAAAVGEIAGFLRVRLDHPKQKEARIPLSGFVRPMLAVTPPAARLGDVDPALPPSWVLVVKNYAETDVELTDATADVPGFRAEVKPVKPGRSYTVSLIVSADAPPGPFTGTLRIRTSSPKLAVLEVPLSGRILTAPSVPAVGAVGSACGAVVGSAVGTISVPVFGFAPPLAMPAAAADFAVSSSPKMLSRYDLRLSAICLVSNS